MSRRPRTHCQRGHELTPENVYLAPPDGRRKCRTCTAQRARKHHQAHREDGEQRRWDKARAAMPTLTPTELAWAAGLFEGEGTVTISGSGDTAAPHATILLANTDAEIIAFFAERWGGCIREKKATEKHRTAYLWGLWGAKHTALFCEQLLPHIRTERVRKKMKLLIEFADTVQQGSRDPAYQEQRRRVASTMREINRKGPPSLPPSDTVLPNGERFSQWAEPQMDEEARTGRMPHRLSITAIQNPRLPADSS